MKPFKLLYRLTFFLMFSSIVYACSTSHSSSRVVAQSAYPSTIERAKKDKRYFILQSGINTYNVKSVELDKSKQQMTVTLDKVDSLHLVYFRNQGTDRSNGASKEPSIYVYTKDSTSYTMDEPHTIPIQNIARVELTGKG